MNVKTVVGKPGCPMCKGKGVMFIDNQFRVCDCFIIKTVDISQTYGKFIADPADNPEPCPLLED